MTHGDLERLLDKHGRELIRQLLQDHLDYRDPGEVLSDVLGAREVRRPHARLRERKLETIFGTVTVARTGYSAHGAETLFPKDAELNLPRELYSHGVQRRAAEEVIKEVLRSSGDGARVHDRRGGAEATTRGTGRPRRRGLRRVLRGARLRSRAAKAGEILALSTDGKGIVMRTADLREATRKAAAERTHKLEKRLSRGEKRNTKRMSQVAAVYTIAANVRRPEDIVTDLGPAPNDDGGDAVRRPRPEHKRVWASVDKTPKAVIEQMFEEALRRDPARNKRWSLSSTAIPRSSRCSKRPRSGAASRPRSCST